MNQTCAPSAIEALTRRTSGLSAAHREFVKILAHIAVADYLRAVAAGVDCTDEAPQPPKECIP